MSDGSSSSTSSRYNIRQKSYKILEEDIIAGAATEIKRIIDAEVASYIASSDFIDVIEAVKRSAREKAMY